MTSVAVIGLGPAGAICARELADAGLHVVAFDKGRGAGGRLATRRRGASRFDHGAQYFTVRDEGLAGRVRSWVAAGAVAPWDRPFGTLGPEGFIAESPSTTRWVGTPGMNGILKHLLRGVDVRFGQRVTGLQRSAGRWSVLGESGVVGEAEHVVVAVPSPQAVPLLEDHPFAAAAAAVQVSPCWSVMATSREARLRWAGARVERSPLSWIARNQTKPGRPGGEQWVLQASATWSQERLEEEGPQVARALTEAARALPGLEAVEFEEPQAHRWRYARVTRPVGEACLHDAAQRLTVCGDGLLGGRVEDALASGLAAAAAVAR